MQFISCIVETQGRKNWIESEERVRFPRERSPLCNKEETAANSWINHKLVALDVDAHFATVKLIVLRGHETKEENSRGLSRRSMCCCHHGNERVFLSFFFFFRSRLHFYSLRRLWESWNWDAIRLNWDACQPILLIYLDFLEWWITWIFMVEYFSIFSFFFLENNGDFEGVKWDSVRFLVAILPSFYFLQLSRKGKRAQNGVLFVFVIS